MIDKMNLAELTYSTELFGFSPLIVQLEVERKLSSLLDSSIKTLQKKLGEKCQNELQKKTVQKSLQQLNEVYHQKSRKILDEFNSTISELLKIPPHVLFPQDEVHRNTHDETVDITQAENELEKTQLLIALAKEELKVLNEMQSSMQDVSECRHFIELFSNNTSEIRKDVDRL